MVFGSVNGNTKEMKSDTTVVVEVQSLSRNSNRISDNTDYKVQTVGSKHM
jgi:hypothetical protein